MMFSRRDQDLHRLEEEVRRLQRLLQEVQERTANHIALLQQQLANKSLDVERLQAKLQSQHDYEEIKAELRTLRALTQTEDDPHVNLESPPSDVSCVSAENDSEFHQSFRKELSKSRSVIRGLPVGNSGGSPASSVSLQMLIKEEVESDAGVAGTAETGGFLDLDRQEMDTARVAQQVKEALQTRNIGQRVFGHYVLGLSQGSVSDILARPKPWSKLTSRGREPFLRMKHFLSDEHGIQTLSVIQEGLRGLLPWVSPADVSSDQVIRNILDQSRLEMLDDDDDMQSGRGGDASELVIRNILQEAKQQMLETPENQEEVHCGRAELSVHSSADFVQSIIRKVKYEIDEDTQPSVSPWSSSPVPIQVSHRSRDFQQVCVESAETHRRPTDASRGLDLQSLELDTLTITHRIKETLMIHNIGQRVFGEEVLGLTQSSVSELLSHPKPWTKLSQKGKENFIRMHLWLRDPHSIQKLNTKKKMDQRARLKRDSLRMSDTGQEFGFGDSGPSEAFKRPRVVLGVHEKETLRSAYQLEPYPCQHTIERLASQLGLLTSTVSNWFYNYRSRIRRDGYCEPAQARNIQSPAGSSPISGGSVPIKADPGGPELDDETERQIEQHVCVSVGVQSVPRVKSEREEDLPSLCSSF